MGQKSNGLTPENIELAKVEIAKRVDIYEDADGKKRGLWKGSLQNNRPVVRVGQDRKHVDVWNFIYNTKHNIDQNTPQRGIKSVSPRDVTADLVKMHGVNITGRPPKYSPEMLKAFESALELTGSVRKSAKIVGLKYQAFLYHVNKHPFLKDALKRGKQSR